MVDYSKAYEGRLGQLFGGYIAPNPYMVRQGWQPVGEQGWTRDALAQVLMNRLRNNPLYQNYLQRDAMRYGIDYPRENSYSMY